jgi:hypothetical protein
VVAPAPLDVIREKLTSATEEVRVVALLHAQRHGAAAQSLAPEVARCFEDSSEAVAWTAMHTFQAIGAGSAAAVALLRAQIAKGTPERLVTRAISSLSVIGPAAIDALPDLLARQEIEALVAIAPDDARVREAIVARVLAGDLTYLARVPECIDVVLQTVLARTDGRLLKEMKAYRSSAVVPRAIELLESEDREVVLRALYVVKGTETSKLAALASKHRDSEVRRVALELLSVEEALPIARDAIRRLRECVPVSGKDRLPGYELAAAAKIVARASDRESAASLVEWLASLPSRMGGAIPNCYSLRDILTATCTLVDDARGDQIAIGIARWVQTHIDRDESGVLDFHRDLRRRAERRGEAFWQPLATLGIPRHDPYARQEEEDAPAPELPDFPPEAATRPPPRLVAVALPELLTMEATRTRAASLVGVALDAEPAAIVDAINVYIHRQQRVRTEIPIADCSALSHLWGEATARAIGWRWSALADGDETRLAIASPDGCFAIEIASFITRQLSTRDTTVVLLFNMLVAGNLPEANPVRVTIIG